MKSHLRNTLFGSGALLALLTGAWLIHSRIENDRRRDENTLKLFAGPEGNMAAALRTANSNAARSNAAFEAWSNRIQSATNP